MENLTHLPFEKLGDMVAFCAECGEMVAKDSEYKYEDKLYCEECFNENFLPCDGCGEVVIKDRMKESKKGEYFCESCYDERFMKCNDCGEEVDLQGDYIVVDGEYICESCTDDYSFCDHCDEYFKGELHEVTKRNSYHGTYTEYWCDDCWEEISDVCDDCGERYQSDYMYMTHNDARICQSCYEDNYSSCDDCGDTFHRDDLHFTDDGYYCDSCYEDRGGEVIHDYSYKPSPEFYNTESSEDDIYMGVELEVDGGGEDDDNAQQIYNISNNVYCKHDGSIHDGFEIVSHPMTLDYHLSEMPWDEVLSKCVSMGYKSHDAKTCGLHVHVGRDKLGDCRDDQDITIMKIIYLVQKYWNNFVKFSRRTSSQLDQWAKNYDGCCYEDDPQELLNYAKNKCERYRAVNLRNSATIEFRIFRGTLNKTTFKATLQFVHEFVNYCKRTDIEDVMKVSWEGMIDSFTKYDELQAYLAKRKLLPTEKVNTELVAKSDTIDEKEDVIVEPSTPTPLCDNSITIDGDLILTFDDRVLPSTHR